jgi:hypothetical protein
MSRAPTASALISTFVRDIPHSLLVLRHDFIGQRWPSSVIAGCRTAPGRPRTAPSAAESSASILRVPVMQHGGPASAVCRTSRAISPDRQLCWLWRSLLVAGRAREASRTGMDVASVEARCDLVPARRPGLTASSGSSWPPAGSAWSRARSPPSRAPTTDSDRRRPRRSAA